MNFFIIELKNIFLSLFFRLSADWTKLCILDEKTERQKYQEIMDPVNVIRAPSLKRGKPDERLSDRVSIKFWTDLLLLRSIASSYVMFMRGRNHEIQSNRWTSLAPSSLHGDKYNNICNIES